MASRWPVLLTALPLLASCDSQPRPRSDAHRAAATATAPALPSGPLTVTAFCDHLTSSPPTPSRPPSAASPRTANTPPPGSPRAIPAPSAPTEGSTLDALQAFGATIGAWRAHHEADPARIDAYLPPLNDMLDRYGSVACSPAGRVVRYRINFVPQVSLDEARAALAGELSPDAALVYERPGPTCEWRQYRSSTLTTLLGSADPDGVVNVDIGEELQHRGPPTVYAIFLDARTRLGTVPAGC
ncbi:MAG: hypothetical protein ABR564_03960 [Candidatus Dormibacteria bacterium]